MCYTVKKIGTKEQWDNNGVGRLGWAGFRDYPSDSIWAFKQYLKVKLSQSPKDWGAYGRWKLICT